MAHLPERLLAIYLNDHLAGATAGVALAQRLAGSHRGTDLERPTADLAEQIEQDRTALLEIMRALDVPPRRVKAVLAVLVERAGRLKLNGTLVRRSPLSSVIELEGMRLGVQGKTDGWQTLRHLADREARLSADRLDDLLRRAAAQSDTLEQLRLRAVAAAFES
jgi:hypothetical protein